MTFRKSGQFLLLFCLQVFFINCSENSMKTNSSQSSLELSSSGSLDSDLDVNSETDSTPSGSGSEPSQQGSKKLSDKECYLNHVSIFAWENSDQDAMEIAPVLGTNKLGTVAVFNGNQSQAETLRQSLSYPNQMHWRFHFIRTESANGSSQLTAYLNKLDQMDTSYELTCYFGPAFDSTGTSVVDPTAKMVFPNIGVGLNGVDGLAGYLSNKDKFIACKASKGDQEVVIHSSENKSITSSNQSLVLKMGCF